MSAPCSPRDRRIPRAIALHRNLPIGSRETLHPTRYVVGSDGDVPCLPATESKRRGVTTRCYDAPSPKRKTCRLLAPSADFANLFKPGFYVWGLPPFHPHARRPALECQSVGVDYDDEADHEPIDTLVLGPYAHPKDGLRVKCLSLQKVFEKDDFTDAAANKFSSDRYDDYTVPTVDMLRSAARLLLSHRDRLTRDQLKAANRMSSWEEALRARFAPLKALQTRCARDAAFARVARQVVRYLFYAAMYMRRWAGPGTRYPIEASETRRLVGRDKQVSPELKKRHVRVSPKGEVRLFDGDDEDLEADRVDKGKLENMYDSYFFAASETVDACEDASARRALERLPMALNRARTTEGGYWPAEETLWEYCYTGDTAIAGAGDETACIRARSQQLLVTVEMLIGYAYKSRPEWSRYEGTIDYVQ